MYAIIQDGGHQYRVTEGQRIRVQLRTVEAGESITFDRVCLVGGDASEPRVGTPHVEGAQVEAKVLRAEVKDRKVYAFFYRRRKGSQKLNGHRQRYTEVQITGISA